MHPLRKRPGRPRDLDLALFVVARDEAVEGREEHGGG